VTVAEAPSAAAPPATDTPTDTLAAIPTDAPPTTPASTTTTTETVVCGPTAPSVVEAPVELGIAEVAERTGVTAHTLRYYERIGLLSVPRDAAGHRVYTHVEVGQVVFISRLRLTAMPIREIQDYVRLVAAGPATEPERLALLERHRDQVEARMGELQSALAAIEYKIAVYGGSCTP
jgi:DNA-binding transcriptional MerR regulator